MFSSGTNASDKRRLHSPTVRSITRNLPSAVHSLLARRFSSSTYDLKMSMTIVQCVAIFNDFVISIIFWRDAGAPYFKFIVANG